MDVNGFTSRTEPMSVSGCRGMTIARLLIAIAIVSTVAMPISRDSLDTAHTAQAIADIGTIEIEISRYKAQNIGELPNGLADLNLSVEQWQDPWGSTY
jgi:type II secretory pathway pseudopilin PulG